MVPVSIAVVLLDSEKFLPASAILSISELIMLVYDSEVEIFGDFRDSIIFAAE
jgi:hypothetical protein